MKRVAFVTLAVVLGLVLFAGTAEVAVRLLHPAPRVQVVRDGPVRSPQVQNVEMLQGEPVWHHPDTPGRREPACEPGAVEVLLLGSSITWGSWLPDEEALHTRLREVLEAEGGSWCVRNYAQSGYVDGNKWAEAREAIPRLEPDVVVWEVWTNAPGGFTRLGSHAYNLTGRRTDAEGYPWVPLVPSTLHHALFHHSRAWEYLTLALAPADPDARDAGWEGSLQILRELRDLTRAHGGRTLWFLAPRLDRPFAQSVEEHGTKQRGYVAVAELGRELGVPVLDLAEALVDRAPEDVRMDPCCHYDARGTEAVAEALAPLVRERAETPP